MKAKALILIVLFAATNLALANGAGGGVGFVDESEISQYSPLAKFYNGQPRLAQQKAKRQHGAVTRDRDRVLADTDFEYNDYDDLGDLS
ncbi:MAG: hypothetical protein ACR2P5_08580 [Gammaproteobacteria bacterium]